jgi:hypothetical protein
MSGFRKKQARSTGALVFRSMLSFNAQISSN